jgi:hypothetical protein
MANEFVIKNGYFSQGNSTVTGSLTVTQNVTASRALISSSGNNQLTAIGSGSTFAIAQVFGSQGNLLSVTDSMSGSIFTISDISGYPILDITSDYYTGSIFLPTLLSQSQQNVVAYDSQSGQLFYMSSSALGGGSGTPGGLDTQIQFNSGSGFSGSVNFTFDYTTNVARLTGSLVVSESLRVTGSVSVTQGGFTGSLLGTASVASSSIILNDTPAVPAPRYLTYVYNTGSSTQQIITTSSLTYDHTTNTIFATASQALTASFFSGFNSTSSIIGNGSDKSFDVVHNFGTRNVHVTVYENSNNYETVYADVRRPDVNTVRVVFGGTTAPGAASFVIYVSQ